ncbi:class I SAM-dependent DNA methyltransferase [Peterkaempfera bronchialis]|uniref:Class I SAM-dependent methyltransferase n=1 Tax=Peterkaempfera bronchialis TaxID=2126346 RepID=A0A345T4J6_9ACTN|nr:class I SAM-dependent methyltransferase [Peterkaempfera bronchialis]AXI80901.1 class I SAM-dependent methyltransferase [Peterkaempfera bronchialis]
MKGQPCLSAGYPEPYAATADTYDRLVGWAIDQWGESPRPQMAAFLQSLWSDRARPVREVLEVCCGTGLMLEQLVRLGYSVTGLDRSEAMLGEARARLGAQVPLVHAELPEIPVRQEYDAVVCAAAALNYLPDHDTVVKTFHAVAGVVRKGGSFVFDLLSQQRLRNDFGTQVWAGDLDDLAFIWKFEHHPTGGFSDLTYTQFRRAGGPGSDSYTAARELHRLYALDHDTVRDAARDAGFTDIAVFDNYSSRPVDDSTNYETWTLTRA